MVERKPKRNANGHGNAEANAKYAGGRKGRASTRRAAAAAKTAAPEAPRERAPFATAPKLEKALLVGVDHAGNRGVFSIEESINELGLLAETGGFEVVGAVTQRMRHPDTAHYVGSGKLEEIKRLKDELGVQAVIFDDELSPSQGRALERALNVPIHDRTALILEIFAQRARTREGELQVQLAQHEYLLPRLAGQWTHLERQVGGIGARAGAGETQLEADRRIVRRRIADLKKELEKVRHQRGLYRTRRRRTAIPVVALVGYTNAGKSTLFNRLTEADVLAENKLFATLDPVTRRIRLPGGQEVLLTDTVGFVQKLPTELVAAFRATLEELEDASLLLHVVDITHPHALEQAETVSRVVADLGVGDRPVVTALNKIDLALAGERLAAFLEPAAEPVANGPTASDSSAAETGIAPAAADPPARPAAEGPRTAADSADGWVDSGEAVDVAIGTGEEADGEAADAGDGNSEADTGDESDEPADVLTALREIAGTFPRAVPLSARTGDGVDRLLAELDAALAESYSTVTRLIPYQRGDLLSTVRARGTVFDEQHGEDGTKITARLPIGIARWLDRNLEDPLVTAPVAEDDDDGDEYDDDLDADLDDLADEAERDDAARRAGDD